MWYDDRRFAVFTVSPIRMKHQKGRGRDRKERGTKEQESCSVKSLLKLAPQRHFGILWTGTVLYILTLEDILCLRWHIEIQLHRLAQRLDAESYSAVSTIPLHGVPVWHCQSMGAEATEWLVVTEEKRLILLQLLSAAAGVARQKKLRGEDRIMDKGVWKAKLLPLNLLQIECHGRTSAVIVLPVRIPLISATAIQNKNKLDMVLTCWGLRAASSRNLRSASSWRQMPPHRDQQGAHTQKVFKSKK